MTETPETFDATASGFFALRTPLLPWDELARLTEGLVAAGLWREGTRGEELAAAIEADAARVTARLRALVTTPVVREALFLASPTLDDGLEAYLADPAGMRARGIAEILVRYVARMAGRATPFGLFSGCSVGRVGAETRLALPPRAEYRRHTRLDMHYVSALAEALERDPDVRGALLLSPSSGLFASGTDLRYHEARIDEATRERTFHLVSVEASPYLEATLARAANGATATALAEGLVDDEITLEDARAFVDELVDTQLLVSELAPKITGPDPLDDLLATLEARAPATPALPTLRAARAEISAIDAEPLGIAPARWRALAEPLAALPAKAEVARLFQVDLHTRGKGATLGPDVVGAVARGVSTLLRVGERREDPALRRFREAFAQRYEGREVPLVLALDEERGVGFGTATGDMGRDPSPLLATLPFPDGDGDGESAGPGHRLDALLVRALGELAREGRAEWELSAKDLDAMKSPRPPRLPDAFAAIATVFLSDAPTASVFLRSVGGPSGAPLVGRFCHGDADLATAVREHLRAEEALRPDAIFAEIVHLPEGRLGNILCRPVLRDHEIAYLGASGAPRELQLSVTDLHVSLEGDRIVLRSARLGREIVPRLTTAHNYEGADLGVYRFLCKLQRGDAGGLGWTWGSLETRAPFLPRVTHEGIVLALARWNVAKAELAGLGRRTRAARFEAVQELRAHLRLPRRVLLADHDHELPVDLDEPLSVDSFVALVKARSQATLLEAFPGPGALAARGPEGAFAHEIVVPFVRAKDRKHAYDPPTPRKATGAARTFAPGSEWLYAKIYGGAATADRVLRDVVAGAVRGARASGAAEAWFFLRYADPQPHLRVRLRGDPARLLAEALPALHDGLAPLLADGRVARLQLDTYEREVERYGGDEGVVVAEAIFHADSEAVLTALETLSGDAAADARWRLALYGMHALLGDVGLSADERLALVRDARASFAAEHAGGAALDRELGLRFRKERASLEALLANEAPDELAPALEALRARSAAIAPSVAALRRIASGRELASITASYLHMHANRMLRGEARRHELVLHDFLARLYESERARQARTDRAMTMR